jgi:hypothetical protein
LAPALCLVKRYIPYFAVVVVVIVVVVVVVVVVVAVVVFCLFVLCVVYSLVCMYARTLFEATFGNNTWVSSCSCYCWFL